MSLSVAVSLAVARSMETNTLELPAPSDVAASANGQLARRYMTWSIVLVIGTQGFQAVALSLLRWSPVTAALATFAAVVGPSFYINKRFVWRDLSSTRWAAEVVPYVVFAVAGLVLALFSATWLERRGANTFEFIAGSVASYFATWVVRFALCAVLFERTDG